MELVSLNAGEKSTDHDVALEKCEPPCFEPSKGLSQALVLRTQIYDCSISLAFGSTAVEPHAFFRFQFRRIHDGAGGARLWPW